MSFLNSVMSKIDPSSKPGSVSASNGTMKASTDSKQAIGTMTGSSRDHLEVSANGQRPKAAITSGSMPPRSNTASPLNRQQPSASKTANYAPQRGSAPSAGTHVSGKATETVTTNGTKAPSGASVAPKKGGYLAALEKAKALQASAASTGQIKHHRVEKQRLSRRERERLAAETKTAPVKAKTTAKTGASGKARAKPVSTRPIEGKRKVETEYKGTMRAKPSASPAYRGTMGGGGVPQARSRPGDPSASKTGSSSRSRYADEDEDEDEDMEDYESASSDMEAGMDDIDEEEMLSTRLARKEDEEALREENEIKRQKLERKRKLDALSAAAAKKKKIY